jgi:hypothetical protein
LQHHIAEGEVILLFSSEEEHTTFCLAFSDCYLLLLFNFSAAALFSIQFSLIIHNSNYHHTSKEVILKGMTLLKNLRINCDFKGIMTFWGG